MKSSARAFALVCLMGLPLGGCTHGSTGEGESFWFYSSRTELGQGRRNDETKNDAASGDVISVPILEDGVRSLVDDDGSRS